MIEWTLIYVFLIIVLVIFLSRRIRIANESERFAIVSVGQFKGFKGQGLHLKWSGGETEWTRLAPAVGNGRNGVGPSQLAVLTL